MYYLNINTIQYGNGEILADSNKELFVKSNGSQDKNILAKRKQTFCCRIHNLIYFMHLK